MSPRTLGIHWNSGSGTAACGRVLAKVRWNTDPRDVNCGSCLKVIARRQAEADAAQKAKG